MSKHVDVYTSLVSPWAYFGWDRLHAIAARHGAALTYKPVSFATIFPESGGLPLAKRAKQRQDYRLVELRRWRDFLGIPLNFQPKFFPADETHAARMTIARREAGDGTGAGRFAGAVLKAVWAEDRNVGDKATLADIADRLGLPGAAMSAAAETDAIRATHEADTAEALRRGVFGAPSFVLDGEIFWGQDRLDFLDRALAKG